MINDVTSLADLWLNHNSAASMKIDPTINLPYEDPATCWMVVKEIVKRDLTPEQYANLAAGLLETLLSLHGETYISEVEELAKVDTRFNYLLGGVWQCLMPDDIWNRIVAIRNGTW